MTPPKMKFGGPRVTAPPQEETLAAYEEEMSDPGYSVEEYQVEDTAPRQFSKPAKWRWSDGKSSSPETIAAALRTIAMMLRNGATEIEAVRETGEELKKFKIGQRLLLATKHMREEAATFQQAMDNIDILPRTAKELINAASTPEEIQRNLRRAARQIVEGRAVRKEIQSQFYEPGFTFLGAIVALFIVVYYGLPMAIQQFETIGVDNPWMVEVLIVLADVMVWIFGALLVLIVIIGGFWFLIGRRSPKIRARVDRFVLSLPAIGPVMQYSSTARLFDLLGVALDSGLSEPKALVAAGRACGNDALREHCEEHARKMVKEDEILGNVGRTTKIIPHTAAAMIAKAPSQPAQVEVMSHYVEEYEDEYKRRLDALTKILPPLIQYPTYAFVVTLVIIAVIPLIMMTTEMTNIQP